MVYIPAGMFQMGDNFNEIGADTLPVHNVTLGACFMDKFEVTKELWDSVYSWAIGHGYIFSQTGTAFANGHPHQNVPWYDALLWCNARSEKDGLTPCYYTNTTQTIVFREGSTNVGCVPYCRGGGAWDGYPPDLEL
jgi:formylglycine-generating enzyme required for sulfatase activity